MSPHRLTGLPWPRRAHHLADQPQHGRLQRIVERATRPPPSRDAAMTYWVRSLLPIEKKSAGIRSMVMAAAGVSTMMPSGGISASAPSAQELRQAGGEELPRLRRTPPAVATIGSMTFERRPTRGAQQRPDLRPEQLRPIEAQAQAAQAEERIGLGRQREARQRLVAADIEGADDARLAVQTVEQLGIGDELLVLVGQAIVADEQEFGAEQADAVAGVRAGRRRPRRGRRR